MQAPGLPELWQTSWSAKNISLSERACTCSFGSLSSLLASPPFIRFCCKFPPSQEDILAIVIDFAANVSERTA